MKIMLVESRMCRGNMSFEIFKIKKVILFMNGLKRK